MSKGRGRPDLLEGYRALGKLRAALAGKAVSEAEVMALLVLASSERFGIRLGEVASALGYSTAKASRCVRKLVSYGLLTESVSKDDRRALCFKVANAGCNVAFDLERMLGRDRLAEALDTFLFLQHGALAAREAGEELTPTQWGIVALLREAERPLRVGELARSCALPQPTASMAVRALEKRGLIAFFDDTSADGRARLVALTDAGERIAKLSTWAPRSPG